MKNDSISFLEEKLTRLTVKSSKIVPTKNPSLLCTILTKKIYNPDSFRAQMRSIWKTKKKFEFHLGGQNLFIISFGDNEDLEHILEGCPWLFSKATCPLRAFIEAHGIEGYSIDIDASLAENWEVLT